MKLKIQLTFKQIFRYAYILFVIVNLVGLFYLYQFINKYVYGSVVVDKNFLIMQATPKSDNINIDKFEEIIKKIEDKTNH